MDPRLEEDAAMARQAAARVVKASEEDDEDDLLSKDFVQLNIGDKSPMVSKCHISPSVLLVVAVLLFFGPSFLFTFAGFLLCVHGSAVLCLMFDVVAWFQELRQSPDRA